MCVTVTRSRKDNLPSPRELNIPSLLMAQGGERKDVFVCFLLQNNCFVCEYIPVQVELSTIKCCCELIDETSLEKFGPQKVCPKKKKGDSKRQETFFLVRSGK